MTNIEEVKKVIKENFSDGNCGIFDTRNIVGDQMTTIYKKDGVTIDICYEWAYFEVFGLTLKEFTEVYDFYKDLQKSERG